MGRAKHWYAVSPIKNPTYVRVPVGEDLLPEIRAAAEKGYFSHVSLRNQILVLVRKGLRMSAKEEGTLERAVDEVAREILAEERRPAAGPAGCQIIPFPRRK